MKMNNFKRGIICSRCGVSKEFNKQMPSNCSDKNGKWYEKHDWVKERMCSCGHGETNHYSRFGVLQCSVGECFPFNQNGHNL